MFILCCSWLVAVFSLLRCIFIGWLGSTTLLEYGKRILVSSFFFLRTKLALIIWSIRCAHGKHIHGLNWHDEYQINQKYKKKTAAVTSHTRTAFVLSGGVRCCMGTLPMASGRLPQPSARAPRNFSRRHPSASRAHAHRARQAVISDPFPKFLCHCSHEISVIELTNSMS